jgi:hypothetical protein
MQIFFALAPLLVGLFAGIGFIAGVTRFGLVFPWPAAGLRASCFFLSCIILFLCVYVKEW